MGAESEAQPTYSRQSSFRDAAERFGQGRLPAALHPEPRHPAPVDRHVRYLCRLLPHHGSNGRRWTLYHHRLGYLGAPKESRQAENLWPPTLLPARFHRSSSRFGSIASPGIIRWLIKDRRGQSNAVDSVSDVRRSIRSKSSIRWRNPERARPCGG